MSYISEKVVCIPNGIEIEINDRVIFVIGKYGVSKLKLHNLLDYRKVQDKFIFLLNTKKRGFINNRSLLGTMCSLLNGMITGVSQGFEKKLHLVGVGYRAIVNEKIIVLNVGFSHVINYKLPNEVSAVCPTLVEIVLRSINKQLIGQVAADLRSIRPPEPFNGKGIRYVGEVLYTKEVKKK